MTQPKRVKELRRIAQETFNYDSLRPGQREAIQSVLAGRDTLAVMATGSGKSAIYQLAGLMIPGPTVVVSPLIALQRDQLGSLSEQDVAAAAALNSTLRSAERREALDGFAEGNVEFLFVAPEQFNQEKLLARFARCPPSLFVVDEAHCISEWGHDFRPDYLRLGAVIEALGHPTVLALTATASPTVREEIAARLCMRAPQVIVRGFDRPNIWLGGRAVAREEDKRQALLDEVERAARPGLVYAATRKRAEELCGALRDRGRRAACYHAGMKAAERSAVQEAFMADELDVLCATSAFGMGIDKPNVRFVFHYDLSGSIDNYYQEVGRAGRDGQPARAQFFYRPGDLALHRFFAGSGQLCEGEVKRVLRALYSCEGPAELRALQRDTGLSQLKLSRALARLCDLRVAEALPTGQVALAAGQPDAAAEAVRLQRLRHDHDLQRIERVRRYAELFGCRREFLLSYFGEAGERTSPGCGSCDNCESGRSAELLGLCGRAPHPAPRQRRARRPAEPAASPPPPPRGPGLLLF